VPEYNDVIEQMRVHQPWATGQRKKSRHQAKRAKVRNPSRNRGGKGTRVSTPFSERAQEMVRGTLSSNGEGGGGASPSPSLVSKGKAKTPFLQGV